MIQYKETDWQFVKRLTSHFCLPILINESFDGQISIGVSERPTKKFYSEELKTETTPLGVTYLFNTLTFLDVGDKISVNNRFFGYISHRRALLEKGILKFEYHFIEKIKRIGIRYYNNEQLSGISLKGKVIAVKKEHVKITLDTDPNPKFNTFFFHYIPISSNIMYSIPEVRANIALFFPEEDEMTAYVSDAFLHNKQLEKNNHNKFLATPKNKTMNLTPNQISRTSSRGGEVSLLDRFHIALSSELLAEIRAQEHITVVSGGF